LVTPHAGNEISTTLVTQPRLAAMVIAEYPLRIARHLG